MKQAEKRFKKMMFSVGEEGNPYYFLCYYKTILSLTYINKKAYEPTH